MKKWICILFLLLLIPHTTGISIPTPTDTTSSVSSELSSFGTPILEPYFDDDKQVGYRIGNDAGKVLVMNNGSFSIINEPNQHLKWFISNNISILGTFTISKTTLTITYTTLQAIIVIQFSTNQTMPGVKMLIKITNLLALPLASTMKLSFQTQKSVHPFAPVAAG